MTQAFFFRSLEVGSSEYPDRSNPKRKNCVISYICQVCAPIDTG